MIKGLFIWNIVLTIWMVFSVWGLFELEKVINQHAEVMKEYQEKANDHILLTFEVIKTLEKNGIIVEVPLYFELKYGEK